MSNISRPWVFLANFKDLDIGYYKLQQVADISPFLPAFSRQQAHAFVQGPKPLCIPEKKKINNSIFNIANSLKRLLSSFLIVFFLFEKNSTPS